MPFIPVGYNLFTEVDEEDMLSLCLMGSWFVISKKQLYPTVVVNQKRHSMSIVIAKRMGLNILKIIDHKDSNSLNNKRNNLREANYSQNGMNKLVQSNNKLGIKGISQVGSKYRAVIKANGKQIHLGYFTNINEAHEAYCNAATKYFGEFANFG